MKPDEAIGTAGSELANLTLHLSWDAFVGLGLIAILCTLVASIVASYGARRALIRQGAVANLGLEPFQDAQRSAVCRAPRGVMDTYGYNRP